MGTVVPRGQSYRAMVRVTGHKPIYKTFDTSKAAKKWVRAMETQLERRKVTNPEIKIVDLIDQYVTEIAPTRKMAPSHLKHDIPSVRSKFENMTMADLVGRGLIEWVLKDASDLTAATRNWHIARLRGVLRQAEHHWNVVVPWDDISAAQRKLTIMGQIGLPKERNRRVSNAELAKIKLKLSPRITTPLPDIFDFCVASAMRIAEVVRIRWDDLDEEARTVIVRDRKHPTKKLGNDQVVPLLNGAFEIVMHQKARRKGKQERIFPHGTQYISKVFHAAATAAGVKDVVLHDLRHEGISRLFGLGFQIQEVALVSGHSEWRTLRRYTHIQPESLVQREEQLRAIAVAA